MIADYAVENTTISDDRVADLAINELRARQVPSSRVYRHIGIEEIELRHNVGHVDVGIVKGADRSHVLPIAIEEIRLDLVIPDGRWNEIAAKVSMLALTQHCSQDFEIEDVDAHRRNVGEPLGIGLEPQTGGIDTHVRELLARRLFAEFDDVAVIIGLEQPKARRSQLVR